MKTINILVSVLISGFITTSSLEAQTFANNRPVPKPRTNPVKPGNGKPNDNAHLYIGGNIQFGGPHWSPWGPPPPPAPPVVMYNGYGPAYYGGGYYGGGYYGQNYYRRMARKTLRRTAQVLYSAIQSSWMDPYFNPVLSKAVWHQRHARMLYYNGDFIGAIHHSRRARYLAYDAAQYDAYNNMGYNYGMNDFDDAYGNYPGGPDGYDYDDGFRKKNDGSNRGAEPNDNERKAAEDFRKEMKSDSYKNDVLDKKIDTKTIDKEEMKNLRIKDLDIEESK